MLRCPYQLSSKIKQCQNYNYLTESHKIIILNCYIFKGVIIIYQTKDNLFFLSKCKVRKSKITETQKKIKEKSVQIKK